MADVNEQLDLIRVGVLHEAVDFGGGLHAGTHVVVVGDDGAGVGGDLTETVEALGDLVPLFGGELRLAVEDRNVHHSLDGVALLAQVDVVGAQGVHVVAEGDEVLLDLFQRLGGEVGAEPRGGDADAAQFELVLEDLRVLRVLVADLGAFEAGQSSLAEDLLILGLTTQLGKVVVGPADRGDAHVDLAHDVAFLIVSD